MFIGDVDFVKVVLLCSYITPAPGDIGPMTIAFLLSNTLQVYTEIILKKLLDFL